jgi:enamine deaminase RidA (YjgF/YER057c/UK114 family)
MQRQLISSGSPYEPVIGFSRAVRVGNLVSVGGTAPIGADGRTVAPEDAAGQTRRCFEIIQAALQTAGADLHHVVRTRIMLKHIADWEAVARVHGEFFRNIRPVSTMVQVTGFIEPQWLVEVEADAVIDGAGR